MYRKNWKDGHTQAVCRLHMCVRNRVCGLEEWDAMTSVALCYYSCLQALHTDTHTHRHTHTHTHTHTHNTQHIEHVSNSAQLKDTREGELDLVVASDDMITIASPLLFYFIVQCYVYLPINASLASELRTALKYCDNSVGISWGWLDYVTLD